MAAGSLQGCVGCMCASASIYGTLTLFLIVKVMIKYCRYPPEPPRGKSSRVEARSGVVECLLVRLPRLAESMLQSQGRASFLSVDNFPITAPATAGWPGGRAAASQEHQQQAAPASPATATRRQGIPLVEHSSATDESLRRVPGPAAESVRPLARLGLATTAVGRCGPAQP